MVQESWWGLIAVSMAGDQRFWLVGVKVLYMVRVWDGVLKEAVGVRWSYYSQLVAIGCW